MKILNFGSLNIDHVYRVSRFLMPGETLRAESYHKNAGGKGLNQSIAFARAGAEIYHAGMIGPDGLFLKELLNQEGVHTDFIKIADAPTGHAIIQVDDGGQNCILVEPGTNGMIEKNFINTVFSAFEAGDYAIFQNELNGIGDLLLAAKKAGMKTILNPSPINENLLHSDLSNVDFFILNEHEGEALSGEKEPQKILNELNRRYPGAGVILTMGVQGAYFSDAQTRVFQPAYPVKAVDTTAAGDTFTGYFFASLLHGIAPAACLKMAAKASSVSVTRSGAASSIPYHNEL